MGYLARIVSLPPLANVFAISADDPSILETIEADLARSGEFAEVWRPATGWVAASQPLPGSESDGQIARANGLVFAEGREAVMGGSHSEALHSFRKVADTADRSPEQLASFPGDFSFARFRDGGSATVVRSCGGLVPIYFRRAAHCTALATRLGDLVRYSPEAPELDPLVAAVWTTGHGFFPDRRTFLTGVSILARGHFAKIEAGRHVEVGRYWNPRPSFLERPSEARAREHSQRLRALLVEHLTRDLDPEGGNLLTLSGGVDSASLAALACGVVGRSVWTLSLLPAPKDLFEHEMSFIQPLAERFGFERRWSLQLRPETLAELPHFSPTVPFPVLHPALCALPGIAREAPVRVLFGGEFADEVCGSAAFTSPDWAACTPFWRLAAFARTHSTRRYLLRWTKARCLSLARRPPVPYPRELGDYICADVRDEYRHWFKRIRRGVARDHAPLAGLAARCEADGVLAMNWEAASALGIRRSFPFFNRDVLELAFQCHPTELIIPGDKKLLRAALRHDVPERNLDRQDKGGWGSYLAVGRTSWDAALPDALKTVVRPDWFPKPPRPLDWLEAWGLTHLVVFSRALEIRRQQRESTGV